MMSRRDRNRNRQQSQTLPDDAEIARQQREMAAAQYADFQKQQQKAANQRRGCIILFILIAAIAIVGGMNSKVNTGGLGGSTNYSAPAPARSTSHSITYKITGTTSAASVTYRNASGGTEQADVKVPWAQSFSADNGQFLYISAQNQNGSGDISCEIDVDGIPVKTSTSSGAYKIATCSGTLLTVYYDGQHFASSISG